MGREKGRRDIADHRASIIMKPSSWMHGYIDPLIEGHRLVPPARVLPPCISPHASP